MDPIHGVGLGNVLDSADYGRIGFAVLRRQLRRCARSLGFDGLHQSSSGGRRDLIAYIGGSIIRLRGTASQPRRHLNIGGYVGVLSASPVSMK